MVECFDDVLIWRETWELHIQPLKGVLVKIEKAVLAILINKCRFGSSYTDYLGCRIEGMIRISEQPLEQPQKD